MVSSLFLMIHAPRLTHVNRIDADVDDDSSWLDPIPSDHLGATAGGNDHIRLPGDLGAVGRPGVHLRRQRQQQWLVSGSILSGHDDSRPACRKPSQRHYRELEGMSVIQ